MTNGARSLRLLALVTDGHGAGGGIAQYNRDLLDAVARSGVFGKTVALPRNGTPSAIELPAGLRQLPAQPNKVLYSVRALEAATRMGPFDVVFCGHLYMAPMAAWVARIAGARLWLQLHGIEAWTRPGPWCRRAAEHADLVTAVSRYTRSRFLAWADCEPSRVKVLPNTVEERFAPGAKDGALLRRLGLEGKKVLLTVSRLASSERYKGHDNVLRAVATLGNRWPQLVYVIAGDGDDRPRLERLAAELGVAHQTRFIGHFPDHALPDLYRSCDVFVMPSTGEGFGIVFLQAMACGLPVIAGDSDGSRDPLRDGLDGALVAAPDVAGLALAIDAALHEPAAPEKAAARFSRRHFEEEVNQLVDLFSGPTLPRPGR